MRNGVATKNTVDAFSGYTNTLHLGLGVVLLAFGLRLPGLIDPLFWSDEMLSLGIAGGSFFETIVSTFRFSAHPPAYYSQLNLWMIGGKNPSFILLNSVLWSTAAVAAIIWMGKSIVGEKPAILAGLAFAIMPLSLYFADNARMYAMICFLQVLGWWSAERLALQRNKLETGMPGALLILALAQLLTGYAHGIGIVFSACLGLFGLVRLWQEGGSSRVILRYIGIQSAVGVLLVPALINGLMRETQHQPPEGMAAILDMLGYILAGPNASTEVWAPVLWLIYFLAAGAVFLEPRIRATAFVLVILPICASVITTLTFKPVLAARPLGLTLPFIAICSAAALVKVYSAAASRPARMAVTAAGLLVAACLLGFSMKYITQYEKVQDFRSAADFLKTELSPGNNVVFSDSIALTWGLSWYLSGPDAVSAARMQPPPNTRWQAMYKRLGHNLVGWLGLKEDGDAITWNGVPVITESETIDKIDRYEQVWLVRFDWASKYETADILLKNGYRQGLVKSFRGLHIHRFDNVM
ncbi:MAG: hypothetical protein ACOY17_09325 [Pseudomonadota bacterium]